MANRTKVRTKVRRITRADEAFEEAQRKAERETLDTSMRYAHEHRLSTVEAQADRMGVLSAWPTLQRALGWFKREWQGALSWAMHEGYSTVEDQDALGAPALTHRWRSYLYGQAGTGDTPEPIRRAMREMARSDNRYERCAAAFLFAMACLDFDPTAAGRAINGHCLCDVQRDEATGEYLTPHPNVKGCIMRILPLAPEFAPYYAQQAIERLRERVSVIERRLPRALPEPEWKARLGIGISEAQAMAEAG